ncbi:hypothetical protein NE237_020866 [Protea cynaroides]|uniref:Carboxypeptidase n=1 Tax=Protea cynaroides TaxID=273540 RepID=A0A9Q0H9A3_9MAGN|nr:hypothetical protein NE237_020866 [Protea cynaroides]
MAMAMAGGKRERLLVSMAYMFLVVSEGARLVEIEDEAEADRITQLPGQPKVTFQQFSGYVTVDDVNGRALFYWFTEAVHHPESKPLIIWFNGGPGCSSVAYGASEEIGPFKINKTGSGLYMNKFSWNHAANTLFLESPAGVGFSYTNTPSDLLDSGDQRTAQDALVFVIQWLERFPRYKKRELYLAGESYAGHYIPQLAREILGYNSAGDIQPINLKGIMVGNAVMDSYHDNVGTVDYWWSHGLISDNTYKRLLNSCDFHRAETSPECETIFSYAMDVEIGKNIDPYNIYAPTCNHSDRTGATTRMFMHLPQRPGRRPVFMKVLGYDPCSEDYAEIYYNRPDVQKALHANRTKIPYKWTACSDTLHKKWADMEISVLPIYQDMIAAGLRIWVYSGDVDSVVPVTATRNSLAQLNLTTKIPWSPWFVKKQVGGWTEVYEELTFATVRGAGHEVPFCKPKAALQLVRSFLTGTPLPKA